MMQVFHLLQIIINLKTTITLPPLLAIIKDGRVRMNRDNKSASRNDKLDPEV